MVFVPLTVNYSFKGMNFLGFCANEIKSARVMSSGALR